jgi:hypothetical protein
MRPSRPLLTFAFVADSFTRTGDITLGLEPLFAPILLKRRGETFDPKLFAQEVSGTYGIFMHPYVALDLAPRLVKSRLLHEVTANGKAAGYIILDRELEYPEIKEEQVTSLIEKFFSFSKDRISAHKLDLSDSELEEALYDRLITMEFLHIINRSQPSYLKSNTLTLRKNIAEEIEDEEATREIHLDYICADFVEYLYRTDAQGFELLSDVSSGALLAEVVLGLRTPPATGQDGSNLSLYFDAPFIMNLIGLCDPTEKIYSELLFNAAKETGAKLHCFTHNIEEIEANIDAPIANLGRHLEVFGPTSRLLLGGDASRAFVVSVRRDVEGAVRRLGIEPVDFKSAELRSLVKYFLYGAEEALASSLGAYHNVNAQLRDAASVGNIIRLRGERQKTATLFGCGAVFVTSNPRLAARANAHLVRTFRGSADAFPPVITDRYLAGALWVAQGGKGAEIPRRRLLANCTSAMLPRRDVVTKMYNFLQQLDPEKAKHFEALITNDRCAYYLMEGTLGDRDLLTLDNCHEIYSNIERATAEKVIVEKDTTINELREAASSRDKEARTEIEELGLQLASAQRSTGELKALLRKAADEAKNREDEALRRSILAGRSRGRAIVWGISLSLAVAGVTLPLVIQAIGGSTNPSWVWVVSSFVSIILIALTIWEIPNFVFGSFVEQWRIRTFKRKVRELGIIGDFDIDWAKCKATRSTE